MFKKILVPVDLAETDLAKVAINTACNMARESGGAVRLLNVMPMTPVMLAEYVPPDFEAQQKSASEEALAIIANECALSPGLVTSVVRQGGIPHEILEAAQHLGAGLHVMGPHRPAMKTYFLGSNAGQVVRYAKSSVLVLRQ